MSGAGGGFAGNVQDFTNAEGRVTDVRSSMDQQLSKLRDEIEATQSGWVGEAAGAFQQVMRRFDDDARGINQSLQRIGELLREAGSTYQKSEQQQNEAMQHLNRGFDQLG